MQAGQTYYVWIDNFTYRQSNYLIQHTVNAAASAPSASQLLETPDVSEMLLRKPKQ